MRSPGLRYWTTKARSATAVDIWYRVGGGVVSPRRVQGWEGTRILSPFLDWRLVRVYLGLELLRLGLFLHLRALSLYVSSGILPMPPPYAQVFVVPFSGNEQVYPPLPFPFCSTKPWKWGRRGMGVPNLLHIVPVRWLGIVCLHGLSLTTMSTRYASTTSMYLSSILLSLQNYCDVPLLFWVLVFCCAKDWT
jgi:hypothetical protein